MSGLARETVTKTLGVLALHGFISYTPDRYLRLNIKKIVDECAGCVQLASAMDRSSLKAHFSKIHFRVLVSVL